MQILQYFACTVCVFAYAFCLFINGELLCEVVFCVEEGYCGWTEAILNMFVVNQVLSVFSCWRR